jgi:hypothetical protein
MQIRHTATVLLLSLLSLAAANCLAQQSPDERVSCPKGKILENGKCLARAGQSGMKEQSIDERKPNSGKDRLKTPHIKECPEHQILKSDQCVPMNK